MAKRTGTPTKRPIEQYAHTDKERLNNPPVGLVTPDTDQDLGKKTYAYDPHLDPQLQWAGKAEHTSFEVPTVSLHVHERIDPRSIIEAVRKKNGVDFVQTSLFSSPDENPPLREAIDFYQHKHGWSNRLIAGDSLLVMNSLIEKEGMAGQVQMVYFDPPYGIKYGSNFQPFINKRDVTDGKDDDLNQEPEMIKAFRDTWELGIHSYLTYLRDRILLARELLNEAGSCFIQISDENLHHVREIMDEIFEPRNFCGIITYRTTGGQSSSLLSVSVDYVVWYAKDKEKAKTKFRQLTRPKKPGEAGATQYTFIEPRDGSSEPRAMTEEEIEKLDNLPESFHILAHDTLYSQGVSSDPDERFFEYDGIRYECPPNTHWKPGVKSGGMQRLANANRLMLVGNTLRYKRYLEDNPVAEIDNIWNDTAISGFGRKKQYVVETNPKVIERCLLLTSDPGDLILDITCGSGTTAFVAEQWGRRWITCDTSRVSITLAKQRLMTTTYPYLKLARQNEGVSSGFEYQTVPHIKLGTIANIPESLDGLSKVQIDNIIKKYAAHRTIYDKPIVDLSKTRVTGPLTVETVPAPMVQPILIIANNNGQESGNSIVRSGETLRHNDWKDELLQAGIRGKGGQKIEFSRVETLPGTHWLHAEAETKGDSPKRVVISFGPEFMALEQRQVALALDEAQTLRPKPQIIVFAAFKFDPEAHKDIWETNWPGVTLLTAEMNMDIQTTDLKKKRASNESFWLIGQPDVELRQILSGVHQGKYQVEVHGFDYFNTKTETIDSGGTDKIAMWMLDDDYDGRSLFPTQVFFPMAGESEGWAKLAKNLKAEIDDELIEAYRGTISLPFELGDYNRVAVKIIDDRGIESLKILKG